MMGKRFSWLYLIAWSLTLDLELLFNVEGLSPAQKTKFIIRKYTGMSRGRRHGSSKPLSAVVFGGAFYHTDSFALASLQRVYCASHTLKTLLPDYPVIVDVGANCGQFTYFSRYYLNASRIISIEPEKESYKLLKLNAVEPADCLDCVVSDRIGDVEFHVATESSQLSSYIVADGLSYRDKYLVPCRTLDSIAADCGITHVDLLKIDTEGSELDVLTSAENLLSATDVVLVEVSLFRKSVGNLFKIGSLLEKKGFEMVEFSCARGRRPQDADALFLRR